jgi:hypothetical protein
MARHAVSKKLTLLHLLHPVVTIFLFCVGIGLRLYYLERDVRFDESLTYLRYASESVWTSMSLYLEPNNHILHTIFVNLSTSAFGDALWAIRLPALIFGVLLMPMTYLVGRAFYGRSVAVIAMGFVAVSGPLIEYSVSSRGYSLVAVIFLALLLLARHLKTRSSVTRWLCFSVLSALGFYTIPTFLYPMGVVALWLLMSIVFEQIGYERRRRLIEFSMSILIGALLTTILYTPVMYVSGVDSLIANEFVVSPNPLTANFSVSDVPQMFVSYFNVGVPPLLYELMFLGVLTTVVFHSRLSRDQVPLAVAALTWLAFIIIVQNIVPYHRIWTYLIPIYFVLSVAGVLFWLKQLLRPELLPYLPASLAVALTLLVGARLVGSDWVGESFDTGYTREAREVADYIAKQTHEDSIFVSRVLDSVPIAYYLQRDYPQSETLLPLADVEPVLFTRSDIEKERVYVAVVNPDDQTILFEDLPTLGLLRSYYEMEPLRRFYNLTVYRLEPVEQPEVCETSDFELDLDGWMGDGARLAQVDDGQALLISGGDSVASVEMPLAELWHNYTLSARLYIAQSQVDFNDISLNFGTHDDEQTYNVVFDADEDKVMMTGFDLKGEVVASWVNFPLETGRWYELGVELIRDQFRVTLDGQEIISLPEQGRRLPLMEWRVAPGAQMLLDNVLVYCKFPAVDVLTQ